MIAHLEDDPDPAIAQFTSRPVEESHAAVGVDQAVLNRHGSGADMLPAGQVFTVEKLLPFISLRLKRGRR